MALHCGKRMFSPTPGYPPAVAATLSREVHMPPGRCRMSVWTWVAVLAGWIAVALVLAVCCGLGIRMADRRRIRPGGTSPTEVGELGDSPLLPLPPEHRGTLRGRSEWARAVSRGQRPSRRRGRRPAPHGLR
jgi:hypothetical protein